MAVGSIMTEGEGIFRDRILKSVKIAGATNTVFKTELPLRVLNENDRVIGKIPKIS